jgi:WD40 repeat protein
MELSLITSSMVLQIPISNSSIPRYSSPHSPHLFALHYRLVIEQTPLLYCSALVFAPEKSVVRKQFKECIPPWIQRKPRVQANWNAALQTLEGHSNRVQSVAFSPDGKVEPALSVAKDWDKTLLARAHGCLVWIRPPRGIEYVWRWECIWVTVHHPGAHRDGGLLK